MVSYLAFDAATSAVPVLGNAVDFFWQGQLMAANALQKDIEKRHGAPPEVVAKRALKLKPPKPAKAIRRG